jgi:hypothetical protein
MLRKMFPLILLAMVIPALVVAGIHQNPKTTVSNFPMISGSEPTLNAPSSPVSYPIPAIDEVNEIIGDTFRLGITWYENQHNGTCGRMNTLDPDGWRQFSWMKAEESGAINRHIWWNGIDPNGTQVFPGTGVAVESSNRGGFVNMDVYNNGAALPTYHQTPTQGGVNFTAVSADLVPHAGAFLDFLAPASPAPNVIIWPRMQLSQNQTLHIVSTENSPTAGNAQQQFYLPATYNPGTLSVTYGAWTLMDWTQTIAADVNTSPVAGSNKTVWAWTRSREYAIPDPTLTYTQLNNDIHYLIDLDGQNPDFSQAVNLTNFIPPDLSLLPDTARANRDTLRAYTDVNCFIDHNNYVHLTFTTRSYFSIEGTSYWNASLIWHWSEQFPDTFSIIGDTSYYGYHDNIDCGAWNVIAQRPSLGEDAAGNLYCMYQVYDTDTLHLTVAPNFWPSGEIYMSVSTDGGMHWAMGTNVTNTRTRRDALPGQSLSELTPTMAKKVDTYCHIQYTLDTDAGNILQTEGAWTESNIKYHRVPVSLIPTTPLAPNIPLHVAPLSGTNPEPQPVQAPNAFALKQNYPNPFNPSTAITFTLDAVSTITLDVYNTRGQMVTNVVEGTYGPGEHTVNFDAVNLPSGVYFCKLTSGQRTAQQKMVLMK